MIRLKNNEVNKIVVTLNEVQKEDIYLFKFENATNKTVTEIELERFNFDNIRYDEFYLGVGNDDSGIPELQSVQLSQGSYTYKILTLSGDLIETGKMVVEGEEKVKINYEKSSKIRKSYER